MGQKIELKSIKDLLGMKFFIPSYQRGYRWTERQVKDLIDDIDRFEPQGNEDTGEKSWYCLQPLVVKQKEKDCYEVIDGQQRLTTIFIILNMIDEKEKLGLEYETRGKGSEEFLKDIKNPNNQNGASNIDFFFMLQAKKAVNDWANGKEGKDTRTFVNKIKEHCRVIWYETRENAYEVFKRLNSGKISLSNAELVKALLLQEKNFISMDGSGANLKQLEMAAEWDRMEQTLHEDAFWYFINPDPENARYESTRMDFILELILRKKENTEFEKNTLQDNYYIFMCFDSGIKELGQDKIWNNIKNIFRMLKSWYDDRLWYHYIGYLINSRSGKKMETLIDIIIYSEKATKTEFLEKLRERCKNTLPKPDESGSCDLSGLEYAKHKEYIHNILLLFNIATTQNQISEQSRYPFDLHFKAAKKKWSLEHIHAQNERKANWTTDEITKLQGYLNQIEIKFEPEKNEKENFIKFLGDTAIDNDTYKAIQGAFMGEVVSVTTDESGKKKYSSDFEKDDSLKNMALLQGNKNAQFNNKLYPEKRAILADYENAKQETEFVPICTRNVFFKHYSPNSGNPLIWDRQSGINYVNAMVTVVAKFLAGSEDITPITQDENVNWYGFKFPRQ